jgi:hypothetical protein
MILFAPLVTALAIAGSAGDGPRGPGIHFGGTALCDLGKPAVSTTFRNLAHLPRNPRFELVLSKAAREFGIDDGSLLLIERRLGGMILKDVAITVTAIEGREGVYTVEPAAELPLDDFSFAIRKDEAIAFFGCSFTTLP